MLLRSLVLAALLSGGSAFSAVAQTTKSAATAATLKDGAFARNGKMYRLQAGKVTPLTSPLRVGNGLTLQPDGTLLGKNGSRRRLTDGKAVNMQGDVVLYRDDMMTAAAIERHDELTTGSKPTVVEIPATANVTALIPELQRTGQRLEQLRQLTDLLAERATGAATGTKATAASEQQIQQLSQQLQP
ncbi:DUF6799 domain-containing protein [Hymenobacter sublimis]|uniref:DUF6799 domain-containing protein n=1 Tax=Hymenobacter sublimis TaxID=2933777 RepID=A0ABY4JC70_9BACT|nr:DUF6799 domain-containing protein [Hymenobacter sublimis]UPL49474.1 hypothetical protein MWH26_00830 [Hymenobacter sublimis]